jgi:hypothetical protein
VAAGVDEAFEADEEDDDEESGDDVSAEGFASGLVSAAVSFFLSPLPFAARESFR